MSACSSNDFEWTSLVVSTSLFLSTTLLSLWRHAGTQYRRTTPQHRLLPSNPSATDGVVMNDDDGTQQQDTNDANDHRFGMEWYRLRRMEDRMSFREVDSCQQDHLPYPQPAKTSARPPNDESIATDKNSMERTRRRSSESILQSNWNHFEGYHSDDNCQDSVVAAIGQPSRNVEHVDDIHPMIKSTHIFRDVSLGSDSGEENLSKLLEGEDLPDQELFCAYESPHNKLNDKHQQKFISPSVTPPHFRSSASLVEEENDEDPTANTINFERSALLKPEPRLSAPSIPSQSQIRRTQSVPDPTFEVNGIIDSQTATNIYVASNRIARTKYNASIMPNKLILIRHGQSLGNVDEKLYATTPDNAMPLTELGWEQARAAGRQLKHVLTSSSSTSTALYCSPGPATSVHFIVSPYVRTVETFHGIVSAWCDPSEFDYIDNYEQRLNAWYSRLMEFGLTWAEDPRIREQDFGNYQEPKMIQQAKRDRHMFGAFYFRFPLGESASDVFDRVSTFLDSLWRSFDTNNSRNYVLVTHGISIRVILARYFRYTIDQFHQLANPRNCEMVVLQHDGAGRLVLGGRYELETKQVNGTENCNNGQHRSPNAVEYIFHPRLRVLPQKYAHKAKVRMKYGD